MNEDTYEGYDTWADPEIKIAYEAALGKFILAYNQIDFYLVIILKLVIPNADERTNNEIHNLPFSSKLLTLKFLQYTSEGKHLKGLPFEELNQLNSNRNNFAHGHMEQNPYDGTYDIIGKRKLNDASTIKLISLAGHADALWDKLRLIEATFWFEDLTNLDEIQA